MTTYNATSDSTADHRQDDCRCPDDRCAGYHHEIGDPCPCTRILGYEAKRIAEFADSLIFIDGGVMEVETRSDEGSECDRVIAYKTTLNRETRELTIMRSDRLYLASDYSMPQIGMPTGDTEAEIRQHVAEVIVRDPEASDEFTFTMPLDAAFDRAREHVVCPEGCEGRYCLENVAMAGLEHSPRDQFFSTDKIRAAGSTYMYTDYLDYRDDKKAEFSHSIEVLSTLRGGTSAMLSGTTDELRALGEFIIAAADRFDAFASARQEVSA